MRAIVCSALLLMLTACAGSQRGLDAGWGFGALDTTSEEEKNNQKWFNSFYGNKQCYGMWGSDCAEEESGGGGGFWGGGVGPSSTNSGSGGNASSSSTD